MKCLVSFRELDSLGEGLVRDYAKRTHSWNAICLDIEGFVTDYLGLKIVYETIREEDRPVLGFLADGTSSLSVSRNGDEVGVIFPKGAVVIEKYLNLEGESSRKRFTLAHEAGHAILARHVPLQTGGCFQNAFDEAVSYGRERKNDPQTVQAAERGTLQNGQESVLPPRFYGDAASAPAHVYHQYDQCGDRSQDSSVSGGTQEQPGHDGHLRQGEIQQTG